MTSMPTTSDQHLVPRPPLRASGLLLLGTSILGVAFMAMHPTSHSHTPAGFAAEAASGMRGTEPIHGILVSLSILSAVGCVGLADLLGWHRLGVRMALAALAFGAACGAAAGLINGFVVPATAATYAGVDSAQSEALVPLLRLCRAANATCARADVIGLSCAALLFSALLLRSPGSRRVVGIVGLICGITPLVLLSIGRLPMNVHGFGFFVLLQSIWTLSVGVMLVRTR